ncbi:MAG: toxin-antitoxin system TumE family protein [Acetobacteraceae bacterium]
MDDSELELLLALDSAVFEMAAGVIVEFTARRTAATPQRPHGISYAFVLRAKSGGTPWVRFDNAHAIDEKNRGYRRKRLAYDHWHRTPKDKGRPYNFTTAAQLLDDFWQEVKRMLDETGIPNDL